MSGERIKSRDQRQQEQTTVVAVGVIATEGNTDAALRTIHRALDRGYDVFVLQPGETEYETVRLAKQFDVEIVQAQDSGDVQRYKEELAIAASVKDYDAVIVSPPDCERIVYDETLPYVDGDALRIDAVTERDVELSGETVVGIPAYNEEGSIGDVVREAREHADSVLVVDDGSADETAVEARAAGGVVIEHDRNQGYGQALKTLFSEAAERDVGALVVIDADGQHDASDISRLANELESDDANLVIGSRFAGDGDTNAPVYRRFGLWVVNTLTNLSMGVVRPRSRVQDTQSGFRAYDTDMLESLAESDEIGNRMSASTDILYHAHENDFGIEEVGTTIDYAVEDASSHNPVSHGLNLVNNILKTVEQQRPITVLGVPGFVSAIVGIGFGYWTFSNFITSGTFPIGLALISVFFALAGTFSCFTGIILHALNQYFG
ncbi:glycosyltransferase family 2 protein [Halosimplex pelagicum]|uniref:Glycosyltransferase n=1 Tax=Halosimplex pelagicum TaxID=869886 RepID=A0A7D5PAX7_9EURY|nr:glycosyltransferase family 2 protein [Halosimplex pelagicum]QLH81338.1 glycosyltransferase [Halosimplex pelagicum]